MSGKGVLLIGCGAVGRVIARHLCASGAIGEVVLADVAGDVAKGVAAQIGSPKARPLRLDASQPDELRGAMGGCDMVVNASLPRLNRGIKEAALDRGLHYLDLSCESSDPYGDDGLWRAQGLTALLGMGEDPGLSNVFARRAADGMERVESIRIRDGDTARSPGLGFIPLFSPETFVEETLAPSRIWRGGSYETVPPLGAFETFEFPAPVGPLPTYSVDHEEVDSLPRFIGKGVQYVDFKLALDGAMVRRLQEYRALCRGDLGEEELARRRRAFFASVPRPADLVGRVDGYAALLVEVVGEARGERRTHVLYTILGHGEASRRFGATATAYLTGSGAALGALLLATGRIREPGVLPPEALDPEPFFPMLRAFGIEVHERVTA